MVVVFLVAEESLSQSKQEEIKATGNRNIQIIHEHPDDLSLAIFYKKSNKTKAHRHNRLNNNAIIQIRKKKATQSSPPKHAHSIKKITHPILFFKIRNKLSFYIVLYEKNVIL